MRLALFQDASLWMADEQCFCCAGSSMADPESAAELSIVETPSYALALVLLFFLVITFVAEFVNKSNRRFLERRSSKGLLVSLFWWLGHMRWAHPALKPGPNSDVYSCLLSQLLATKFQHVSRCFGTGSWHG